jgi:hypothetical protein
VLLICIVAFGEAHPDSCSLSLLPKWRQNFILYVLTASCTPL